MYRLVFTSILAAMVTCCDVACAAEQKIDSEIRFPNSSNASASTTAVTIDPEVINDTLAEHFATADSALPGSVNRVGKTDAPVEVVVFQDLQCGMCAFSYKNMFGDLNRTYISSGKVRYTFIEFPLSFGGSDLQFAQAAKCAAEQGKYLDFVAYTYTHVSEESSADLIYHYAKAVGLKLEPLKRCVTSKRYLNAVRSDFEVGQVLGVEGTPTFFVNGREVGGARTWSEFKPILDQAMLGSHYAGTR